MIGAINIETPGAYNYPGKPESQTKPYVTTLDFKLNKTEKRKLNKTSQRNQNTQTIRAIKQVLNRTSKQALENWYVPDDIPTLEELEKQGEDWRLYIEYLVLWDVIRKYWDEPKCNKSLKQACMNYLNSLSHINGLIGHNPRFGTLVL